MKPLRKIYLEFKTWRKNSPVKATLQGIRQRAKQERLPYSLSYEALPPVPEFCPVFSWIQLRWHKSSGKRRGNCTFPDSPSLDRIDNSRGYEIGNVRWISQRANRAKADLTDQEMVALGDDAFKRMLAGAGIPILAHAEDEHHMVDFGHDVIHPNPEGA